MGHIFQFMYDRIVIFLADIRYYVASRLIRFQLLADNVHLMLGKHAVYVRQHAGTVVMDVNKSVRIFKRRQLNVRDIDAQIGVSCVYKVHNFGRNKLSDVFLRLLCASADVGREDYVRQILQLAYEFLVIAFRLARIYVNGGTGEPPAFYALCKGGNINHKAAAQIQKKRTVLHHGKLSFRYNILVSRLAIHMHGHDIAFSQ